MVNIRVLYSLIALFFIIHTAHAATYTVAPIGGDFTRIQDAIDAANNGDTIQVFSGTYFENVNINKPLTFRGVDNGGGQPLLNAMNHGHGFSLNADRISIEGFIITSMSECGIYIGYSRGHTITRNTISDGRDGICSSWSNDITIQQNQISNIQQNGISLSHSSKNIIDRNTITNVRTYHGINLDSESNDNSVLSNTLTNIAGLGISLSYSKGSVVSGNTISKIDQQGISLNHVSDSSILNNGIGTVLQVGIGIGTMSDNNTVQNNRITDAQAGIYVWQSRDNKISKNTISNIREWGIGIDQGAGNFINQNKVDNAPNEGGLSLFQTTQNLVASNNISNVNFGISISESLINTIEYNSISSAGDSGINLQQSRKNSIRHNRVSGVVKFFGIHLGSSSDENIVTNNSVSQSHGGIGVVSSNGNTIYLNNFYRNQENGGQEGSNNPWISPAEITYQFGESVFTSFLGNYWEDYKGEDSNGDGIGDTPYLFRGGSDNRPLINLWNGTRIDTPSSPMTKGATTIVVQGNETGKWVLPGTLFSYGIAVVPIGIIFFLDKRRSTNYKASSSRWTKYITIGHTLIGFSFLFGTCWIYIFGLQAQTIPITFSFWFSGDGIALFLLCTAFASASLSSFILSYSLRMSTPLRWINRLHILGAILFALVFLIPMIIAPNSSFTKESMAPLWVVVASISAFAAIWQYRGIVEIKSPPPERKIETPTPRVSGNHHDVFISYSQQDKPVADAITVRLESQGIRCWIAPRDVIPGKNFPEAIVDAIDECRIMVLVFSSYSNNSPHVIRELTRAVSQEVIIVPFRIEDIQPSKSMAYLINVPHWLDALTLPVEKHIDKLVEIVQLLLK